MLVICRILSAFDPTLLNIQPVVFIFKRGVWRSEWFQFEMLIRDTNFLEKETFFGKDITGA